MWKTLRDRLSHQLKGERGVRLVVMIGVIGLALILLSRFVSFEDDETQVQEESTWTQNDISVELEAYCSAMEKELAEILV
ncbi:MAG: hypothetical protein LUC50_06285 [Ruminococcus sp.]|nr:hypothetical protein [Ruminococcus sp.]